MQTQIYEDKILEFKALVMNKSVFNQLRNVGSDEISKLIGWVQGEMTDFFVGELGNTLVKVRRTEMWDYMAGTQKAAIDAMVKDGLGTAQAMNALIDELRDSLPQIFVK